MAWKIAIVRKKLFIPLALAMAIFFCGLIYSVYRLQWENIHADTQTKIESFHKNYQSQVQAETELLNAFLLLIKENKEIQQDWLTGNREALLRDAGQIFQELRKRSLVTHLYFISLDKKCFLRVHHPKSHGDLIDRTTMDIAAHLGKPASGVEMGPFGTVALRAIHPWVINGKLAGYIELSEDVEQMTSRISGIMNIDLLSVVDKKFLDKEKWEQGQRMSGRSGRWDQYQDFVIVSSNTAKKHDLTKILDFVKKGSGQFLVTTGGQVLNGGFDPSIDAAGNNIGRFVIFSDVTREERAIYGLLIRLGSFTLVLLGLTLAFFDWYISRIHHKYAVSNAVAVSEDGPGAS